MSSNAAVDSIVMEATEDFKEPKGEFGIIKADFETLTGISDPIDKIKALEARAFDLGKWLGFSVEEKESNGVTWLYIGWQTFG